MLSLSTSCVQLKHLSSAIRSVSNHRPISKTIINLPVLETPLHQCLDFREFKQILSQMILTGFIKDTFSAKRLLQFSTRDLRFIHLDYSYQIFNVIENADASIYNIMMMAYVRRNYPHRAIHFYKLMLYRNVDPNVYTYPFLVEACAIRDSKLEGKQMHNHVLKLGFDSDVHVRSTFVDMYANYSYSNAEKVFHEGPMMDSFVWYSLLEVEVRAGGLREAEYIYNLMPEKDTTASTLMFVSFQRDRKYKKAEQFINEIPENDTVSWSALINCLQAEYREMYEEAFYLFMVMHANGIWIDELVAEAVLHCCIKFVGLGDIKMMGKLIHSLVVKIGIECDVKLQNSLICMYSECEETLSAQNLFDAAGWLDECSWRSMLIEYMSLDLHENVKALFESMPENYVDSCGVMISYYTEHGCFFESLALFHKMVASGIRLGEMTLYGIIKEFPGHFALLDLAKCIHAYVIKNGYSLKKYGSLEYALYCMYNQICGYGMPERGFY